MSCIVTNKELLKIDGIVSKNINTPLDTLIPTVIYNLTSNSARAYSDLRDPQNIELIHDVFDANFEEINDGMGIDLDSFKNIYLQEISNYESENSVKDIEDIKNVRHHTEVEDDATHPITLTLKEPTFKDPEFLWKQTPKEIMDTYFPEAEFLYNRSEELFMEMVYRHIGFDYVGGELFLESDDSIAAGMDTFKAELQYHKNKNSEAISELKAMGPQAKSALIKDTTGKYHDAYIFMLMEDLIPHYMSANFNDSFAFDGENYSFDHAAVHRTSWSDDGVENASTSFMVKPHLNTAHYLKYEGNKEYTATGKYLNIAAVQNIISRNPQLVNIYNSSKDIKSALKQMADLNTNEAITALYYRFYNTDDPVSVKLPSGRTVDYYSLSHIKDNPLKYSRKQRRLAEDIITNFEVSFMNVAVTTIAKFENNTMNFVNLNESYSGGFSNNINTRLQNHGIHSILNGDDLSLSYKGKTVAFKLAFNDSYGAKFSSDAPIRATLTEGTLTDAFDILGFGLPKDKAQKFIELYNTKFKNDKNPIHTLLGTIGASYHANEIGETKGIEFLTGKLAGVETGISSKFLKGKIKNQKDLNSDLLFSPAFIAVTPFNVANEIYQKVFDLNVADQLSNFEGNNIPKYSMQNALARYNYFLNKAIDANSPFMHGNAFMKESKLMQLDKFVYRDAYYSDEYPEGISQSSMTPAQRAEFAIVGGYGSLVFENPDGQDQHALVDVLVASDKSMQPDAYIKSTSDKGFIPKNSDGNLDVSLLLNQYKSVAQPYWAAVEEKILTQYSRELGIEATSLRELQSTLDELKINTNDAATKNLPAIIYRHFKFDAEGNKYLALRDDLIAFTEIHADEALLKKYLSRQRKKFAASLGSFSDMGIKPDSKHGKTTGLDLKLKISDDLNEKISKRFGDKWADGKIYDPESKLINPLVDSYFFTKNIATISMDALYNMNTFQYKAGNQSNVFDSKGKIDFEGLDLAISPTMNDKAKRTPAITSSFNRMILADGATEATRKLDKNSNVLVTNDIDVAGVLLANGVFAKQESQDGAHYIHPLHSLRMMHSFGGQKTPLKGSQIKNMLYARNEDLGTSEYHKLATHPMDIEWMKQSVDAPLDWNVVNEMFLKGTGDWDTPVQINYTSEYDPNIKINGTFNNLYEVYDALNKANGTGGTVGYPEIFHDLLEVTYDYPETRHNYIGVLEFTTSIKSSASNVNNDLLGLLKNFKEGNADFNPVYSTVNNEFNGIQLNPNHEVDEEHVKDALSPITQLLTFIASGGYSTSDVSNIYDALNTLTDYNLEKEFGDITRLDKRELTKYIDKLVKSTAKKDSNAGRVIRQKTVDGKVDIRDPQITDIAISQLNARMEKIGVKPKFTGGQFVVRSVANSYMVYDIVAPNGKKYTMPYQEMVTFTQKYPGVVVGPARNIKWVEYVDTATGTTNVQATELFKAWGKINSLTNLSKKNPEQALAEYTEARDSFPLPEIVSPTEIEGVMVEIGSQYQEMMDSGDFTAIPGEIILPNVFRNTYGIQEGDSIAEIFDNPNYFGGDQLKHENFMKAMEGIDARIPGSSMQSGHTFRVVGFVEAEYNVIGIPVESMLVKGEDLDIDKANLQLMSIALQGSKQGIAYPYFTDPETNRLLSKDEILNNPETAPIAEEWEAEYTEGDDWYMRGVLNYITMEIKDILIKPRNMIEANTTVSTANLDNLAKSKPNPDNFSPLLPTWSYNIGFQNAGGQKMVGFEANASKAYWGIYHSTQKKINQGLIGVKSNNTGEGKVAFTTKFSKGSLLGGPYFDVANTKHAMASMYDSMDRSKMSPQELETLEMVMKKTYQNNINEQNATAMYSELVNAATDNAKDPKLGKLGIDETLNNYLTVGIAIGIPIEKIIGEKGLLSSKRVFEVLKLSKDKNITVSAAITELYPDKKDRTKYADISDFMTLGSYANEFTLIATLFGINSKVPNNKFEMFKLYNRLQKELADPLSMSIDTFLFGDNYAKEDIINRYEAVMKEDGKIFNPFEVLYNNPQYIGYLKTAKISSNITREVFPSIGQLWNATEELTKGANAAVVDVDEFMDAEPEKVMTVPYKLTEAKFRKLEKFYNLHIVNDFFKEHLPMVKTTQGSYDLVSDLGKSKFVRRFPEIVEDLRNKYPNNYFIQTLQEATFFDFGSTPVRYIKPLSNKVQREQDVNIAQQDLTRLSQQDLATLYAYSLLMKNNVANTTSFESMFNEATTPLVADYNKVRDNATLPRDLVDKATYLIEDFSTSYESVQDALDAKPRLKEFKVFNKNTKKFEFFRWVNVNGEFNEVELAAVAGTYSDTIVGLSINTNALSTKYDQETDEKLERTSETYHKDVTYPYYSTMDKAIKSVAKFVKDGKPARISVNSGYKSTIIAETLSKQNPSFKIVSAAEALNSKSKDVIITRADKLTPVEVELLEKTKNNVVFIGLEGDIDASKVVMKDVDAFTSHHDAYALNVTETEAIRKTNIDKSYTKITNSSADDLKYKYIYANDAVLISEEPGYYNEIIREELFGEDAAIINKGEKLMTPDGSLYTVIKNPIKDTETVITSYNNQTLTLQGFRVKVVSKDGNSTNMFVVGPKSLEANAELLAKVEELHKFNRVDGKPSPEEIAFRNKFTKFGSDIVYGYSMRPDNVKYLFESVLVDEDSLREDMESNQDLNSKMKDIFLSSTNKIHVKSKNFAKIDKSINKPTRTPVLNKTGTEADFAKRRALIGFAKMLNNYSDMFGINTSIVDSHEIQADPVLGNEYRTDRAFKVNDVVYMNVSAIDELTPISEYTQVWLNIIGNNDNKLYTKIRDYVDGLSGTEALRDKGLTEDSVISRSFEDVLESFDPLTSDRDLVGLVNEYHNTVASIVKTIDKKVTPDMSITKMALTMYNTGRRTPMTAALTEYDGAILTDLHNDKNAYNLPVKMQLLITRLKEGNKFKEQC